MNNKMNYLKRAQTTEETSSSTDAMTLSHPTVTLGYIPHDKCIVTEDDIKNAELIKELMG